MPTINKQRANPTRILSSGTPGSDNGSVIDRIAPLPVELPSTGIDCQYVEDECGPNTSWRDVLLGFIAGIFVGGIIAAGFVTLDCERRHCD